MLIPCASERDILNALYALDPFLDPCFWFCTATQCVAANGAESARIYETVTPNS